LFDNEFGLASSLTLKGRALYPAMRGDTLPAKFASVSRPAALSPSRAQPFGLSCDRRNRQTTVLHLGTDIVGKAAQVRKEGFGGKDRRQQLSQHRGQERQQTNNASDGAEPTGLSDSIHHMKSLRGLDRANRAHAAHSW